MRKNDATTNLLRMLQLRCTALLFQRSRSYQYLMEGIRDDRRRTEESHKVTVKPQSVSYGTTDKFSYENSICNLTFEAYPRITNYKDDTVIKRPSLGELHGDYNVDLVNELQIQDATELKHSGTLEKTISSEVGFKLGWIQGVLIPCLLNIWGVMLFLRMPWIVSQAGIFQATVIIVISTVICGLTTLSLSALCTNGEVKGGGIYFIISRSLGPEFGASVGIVLAFANAVSASLNTIGFCESLNDLLWNGYQSKVLDDNLNSIRLVGIIAILVMILICAIGIEWESKAQNILIALICLAMVDFFVGTILGPMHEAEKLVKGFEGFSVSIFAQNWISDYKFRPNNFMSVFALFFPSVTGIQAGANISGDLKDPSSSIPKGTLLSLVISMISYIAVVFFAGGAAVRQASGNVTELADGSFLNCMHRNCKYGLQNDFSIMNLMSIWSIWIYIGCFAATLSTALTNLLTVPRLLKALGDDEVYPGLTYFAKGYGKNQEPLRGYVLTFFVSVAFVLIASLDAIAPLITNFYLASYALINFCTFHAALVRPLGWRPTFQCYNKWLSLFSCGVCILLMLFIDWITSAVTFVTFFTLYLIVVYRQPDVNWGSTTQAQLYKSTLASSYRLVTVNEHVKNYQPHILLLSGKPNNRPEMLDLANLITKRSALLICANIVNEKLSYKQKQSLTQESMTYLHKRKIKAFCSIVDGMHFEDGVDAIIQCCGIGKLSPNILMMGYKSDWMSASADELEAYFNVLHNAFHYRLAVAILRMPKSEEGKDIDRSSTSLNGKVNTGFERETYDIVLPNSFSNNSLNYYITDRWGNMPNASPSPVRREEKLKKSETNIVSGKNLKFDDEKVNRFTDVVLSDKQMNIIFKSSIFTTKLKKPIIDVWWLYDDGGLTLLLPYILNMRSIWSNISFRIFTLTNDKNGIKTEKENMANLLAKFRIHYSSLTMLTEADVPHGPEMQKLFDKLIEPYRRDPNSGAYVSENELKLLQDKTNRQLRLKELLLEYSTKSTFVVMSLPMPRKGILSAPVYTAWLEILTSKMPPFLLVRGNHTPVLTFYS